MRSSPARGRRCRRSRQMRGRRVSALRRAGAHPRLLHALAGARLNTRGRRRWRRKAWRVTTCPHSVSAASPSTNGARPRPRRRSLAARGRSLHPRRARRGRRRAAHRRKERSCGALVRKLWRSALGRCPLSPSCRSPPRPTRSSTAGSATRSAACHRRARRQGRTAARSLARLPFSPCGRRWPTKRPDEGRRASAFRGCPTGLMVDSFGAAALGRRPSGQKRRRPHGSLSVSEVLPPSMVSDRRRRRAKRAPLTAAKLRKVMLP